MIAAPIHQKEKIFKEYLNSIDNLIIPNNVTILKFFIFHNCLELIPLVEDKENVMFGTYETPQKYQTNEITHVWSNEAVVQVIKMKNAIIDTFLKSDFDYIFFIDSDLILDPLTLKVLLENDKDIIAEIFWTQWQPEHDLMPNAWDFNNYEFRSLNRLKEWKKPGVYEVGMTGACTLIKRKVFESGVNFSPLYNINYWGEDRHFCIRAAAHNFDIWIDTHYPAIHLYRESEYEEYIKTRGIK